MTELLNEPVQTKATTMMVTPILETIHETQEQVTKTPPATPPTKINTKKNQTKNLVAKAIKKKNDWKKIYELETRFRSTKPSHTKRTHDDQDPKDHEGEKSKKRRHRGAGEYSSKKNKDQDKPPHFERGDDEEEPRQNDKQLHEDHKVQNNEIPRKHNPYKITKEDVDGLAFELHKGTCKNNIELEYNMDQCSLALIDKIVWINPEGSKERTYALSITKIKAARYKDEEIEEMIPYLWSPSIHKYNRDATFGICHCIKVDKRYGYAYLEEIVVTQFDEKEYKFCEADFLFLNQNDIEDLYLMKIQNKICNIKGTKEYDLVNALKMYIYRIVIQKIVEDVQMRFKSYQTKLNLTKPLLIERLPSPVYTLYYLESP
ncbi:hypothetical protein Tco_0111362 [Tanacetum coccineum]